MSHSWGWLTLAGLGAFHGLNPAMGWLFAVARGLHERRRAAVLGSLPAIAAGHEASVLAVIGLAALVGSVAARHVLTIAAAGALIGFGAFKLISRRAHPRWVGFRLRWWELSWWAFVMACAHGAGLMLVPVFLDWRPSAAAHAGPHLDGGLSLASLGPDALALTLHVGAMLVVMGTIALVVYETVGVGLLRRAWVNLERVWAVALVGAGALTLFV